MDRRIRHRATFKERLAEEARRITEQANACVSGQTSRDRFEHQRVADIPRPSFSHVKIERKPGASGLSCSGKTRRYVRGCFSCCGTEVGEQGLLLHVGRSLA